MIPKKGGDGDRPFATLNSYLRLAAKWYRRTVGERWEKAHQRTYLFGTHGRAAPWCVWRLGVLAENAVLKDLSCTALLLDIAKAFENVLHEILVGRALAMDFPDAILRFWLALYQGPRRIIANKVVGIPVNTVNRTIVAGDSFADLFMRMMIVPIIDKLLHTYSCVIPGAVADDIQILTIGTEQFCQNVGAAMSQDLIDAMRSSKLPLSIPNLVLLSSSPVVGENLVKKRQLFPQHMQALLVTWGLTSS